MLPANEVLGAKVLAANKAGGVGGVDGWNDGLKHVEPKTGKFAKSLKLSKSGNSKGKNLAKSKKLSKSGNLSNFGVIKAGPSFLTPGAREAFNYIQLIFIEAPIL